MGIKIHGKLVKSHEHQKPLQRLHGHNMPLLKGKENMGRNVAELIHAGKPKKQAVAIAYDVLRDPRDRMKKKDSPKGRKYYA